MKILNAKNSKWVKRFKCRECHSELEVEESDLKVVNTAVGYAGDAWEPEIAFYCGVCQSENFVTKQIPSGISWKLISAASAKRK